MLHNNFLATFTILTVDMEKRHIENKMDYTRRNLLVPIPEFEDIKEYNWKLLKSTLTDIHRKH